MHNTPSVNWQDMAALTQTLKFPCHTCVGCSYLGEDGPVVQGSEAVAQADDGAPACGNMAAAATAHKINAKLKRLMVYEMRCSLFALAPAINIGNKTFHLLKAGSASAPVAPPLNCEA